MRITIPTKLNPRNLTTRAKLLVAAGVIVAGTSTVAAINAFTPSTAEPMSPTDITVQEHEGRLDKNEADIAATNDRVDQVEQQTSDNTAAIGATQDRVTVVERQTQTIVQKQAEVQATPTPAPAPAPAPEPVTPMNPRVVTAVVVKQTISRYGEFLGWECTYTLMGNKVIVSHQGYECYEVGEEISADIATMHGIGTSALYVAGNN